MIIPDVGFYQYKGAGSTLTAAAATMVAFAQPGLVKGYITVTTPADRICVFPAETREVVFPAETREVVFEE